MNPAQDSREAEAFYNTLDTTSPRAVSACVGWTAHEVTAHLAAAAAEVVRHLAPYLEGRPVPATRTFEEREARYRAMDDPHLRRRLASEMTKAQTVIAQVLDREPEAVIPWTGRQMAVAKFVPHLRSEFALHRWDLAGDDPISAELLGQTDLTVHAISVLGSILPARGLGLDPAAGRAFHVSLRALGAPDIRLVVESGQAKLELAPDDADGLGVELDPAARLLVIWGRRPTGPNRFRSNLEVAMLARLQALLSGY